MSQVCVCNSKADSVIAVPDRVIHNQPVIAVLDTAIHAILNSVIVGLDPTIHGLSKNEWIPWSSQGMTTKGRTNDPGQACPLA